MHLLVLRCFSQGIYYTEHLSLSLTREVGEVAPLFYIILIANRFYTYTTQAFTLTLVFMFMFYLDEHNIIYHIIRYNISSSDSKQAFWNSLVPGKTLFFKIQSPK